MLLMVVNKSKMMVKKTRSHLPSMSETRIERKKTTNHLEITTIKYQKILTRVFTSTIE